MNANRMAAGQRSTTRFLLQLKLANGRARVGHQLALAAMLLTGFTAPVVGQETDAIDEIVVTAERREQSLQEVPVSIAVFSEDQILNMNVGDVAHFADTVPGMGFATTGPGNSQYIIRGVGQVGQGLSPTTGVYLDEVPLHTHTLRSSSQPDPQLFDVARVEVLRGPQGVLFGSSAMGGSVRIITNQPDPSAFEALVDTGVSNIKDGETSWDVKGMVNIPLADDKLALRIVGLRGYQGGWIDDLRPVTADISQNMSNPANILEDTNSADYSMARVALRYTPDDTWAITPSVFYQVTNSNVDRQFSDMTFGIESRLKARYQDTFGDDELLVGNLLIEKDLDIFGGLSILSSSSYLDATFDNQFDSTAFRSPQIEAIVGPSPNGELYWSGANNAADSQQFTQEIRATSTSESRLQYIVGVYYKTLDQASLRFRPSNNLYGATAPLPFGATDPPTLEESFVDFQEDELALFGQVEYALTDLWTISAGARFYSYDQTDSRRRYGVGGEAGGVLSFQFSEQADETGVNPRLILTYQPNDNINVYGSYSTGFRSGGVNAPITDDTCTPAERAAAGLPDVPPPFTSDALDNIELGLKSRWVDGRLIVNLAAYSITWDDFQQSVQTTCGPNAVQYTANAGEVSSDGAELEFTFYATDQFLIGGGAGYTDAIYIEPFTNLGLPAGAALLDVPKLIWNIRGEYSFPVSQYWDGHMMLSANYVDDTISGFGEGEPVVRPAYNVIDGIATLTNENLSFSVFVDNITDETQVYGQEFATSPDNTTATSYFAAHTGQPRTVGVRVRVGF